MHPHTTPTHTHSHTHTHTLSHTYTHTPTHNTLSHTHNTRTACEKTTRKPKIGFSTFPGLVIKINIITR